MRCAISRGGGAGHTNTALKGGRAPTWYRDDVKRALLVPTIELRKAKLRIYARASLLQRVALVRPCFPSCRGRKISSSPDSISYKKPLDAGKKVPKSRRTRRTPVYLCAWLIKWKRSMRPASTTLLDYWRRYFRNGRDVGVAISYYSNPYTPRIPSPATSVLSISRGATVSEEYGPLAVELEWGCYLHAWVFFFPPLQIDRALAVSERLRHGRANREKRHRVARDHTSFRGQTSIRVAAKSTIERYSRRLSSDKFGGVARNACSQRESIIATYRFGNSPPSGRAGVGNTEPGAPILMSRSRGDRPLECVNPQCRLRR